MYKFNINDFVKVKLTERGKEIYKHRYDEMFEVFPHLKETLGNPPELKIDKDGYSEFQLHDFMHCFGPYIFNGAPLVIENNEIYFESRLIAVKPDLGKLREHPKAPTIPKLDIKIKCTPVKNSKYFGDVGKMIKECETESKSDTTLLSEKTYQYIMNHDDVRNTLLNTYCENTDDIKWLCDRDRLTMEYYTLDKYKSFEVYYIDEKPIIEVTIEKRYNELHGYGYLSQTEEKVRSIKMLK